MEEKYIIAKNVLRDNIITIQRTYLAVKDYDCTGEEEN